ncbi:MAG TPA: transcriptional regulator [Deltaproteobacteria bacterium]|nr:transcriptional regulator [Deltaproteobacteria bacterium]
MPVYEYACTNCGKQFEEFQKLSDKPLKKCKICGGTLQRLISQSSFALKGGGWYKDGYSNSNAKPKETPKSPTASSAPPAAKASSS